MSYQFVIDNAAQISMDKRRVVAATSARDGTARLQSRGAQPWVFEVVLPTGPRWTDYRGEIAELEKLDQAASSTIKFSNSGHSWIVEYLGDAPNGSSHNFLATWTKGFSSINVTASPTFTSGYKFRRGDFIQLGSTGHTYMVTQDCLATNSTVYLHRPIIDDSGTNVGLRVAENCEFKVYCANFPKWNLFERDQIEWQGSFLFVEDVT